MRCVWEHTCTCISQTEFNFDKILRLITSVGQIPKKTLYVFHREKSSDIDMYFYISTELVNLYTTGRCVVMVMAKYDIGNDKG